MAAQSADLWNAPDIGDCVSAAGLAPKLCRRVRRLRPQICPYCGRGRARAGHATTSPYIVNAQEPEDRQSKGFRTEDERLASAFETSWPPRSGRPVSPGLCSKEPQNKERR
jgi:hypothetical protein